MTEQPLTGVELDERAETLFWLDERLASIGARRQAYAAHVTAGDGPRAAMSAWHLFYEHFLVGESAQAHAWLNRSRSHLEDPDGLLSGFLALADADVATAQGRLDAALGCAEEAEGIAESTRDPVLRAMASQVRGRVLARLGHTDEALAALDEAMLRLVEQALPPLFTGWVYCAVLGTCRDLADLRRAAEWTDAALRWCAGLEAGRLYPGTCRVHLVELACLRGDWLQAREDAQRACRDLTAHDPRYAGEAYYQVGELCRLLGETDAAADAYARAQELGRPPQPGLARLHLQRGEVSAARNSLRTARAGAPIEQAHLLSARVDAAVAAGQQEEARAAAADLDALASRNATPYLDCMSHASAAAALTASGDPERALRRADEAAIGFAAQGFPYECARARVTAALAARASGEDDLSSAQLGQARATFLQLGAVPDLERIERLADQLVDGAPGGLTDREVQVLRLVARGRTNREIGSQLSISEHTVAHHVSSMLQKLSLPSRAAATAYAYEHALLEAEPSSQI